MKRMLVAGVSLLLLLTRPVTAQTTSRGIQGTLTAQYSAACAVGTCVTLPAGAYRSVSVQLTGTWMGTVTFKCSVDGTNFIATNFVPFASATPASTATGNGAWSATLNANKCLVEFTTKSSGTVVVTMRAGYGS